MQGESIVIGKRHQEVSKIAFDSKRPVRITFLRTETNEACGRSLEAAAGASTAVLMPAPMPAPSAEFLASTPRLAPEASPGSAEGIAMSTAMVYI